MLVLAVVLAAVPGVLVRPNQLHHLGSSAAALIGLTKPLASTLLSMVCGFADAGGFSFGWFHGCEPMNSLRLCQTLLFAPAAVAAVVGRSATIPTIATGRGWVAGHDDGPADGVRRRGLGAPGVHRSTILNRPPYDGVVLRCTPSGAALDGFPGGRINICLARLWRPRASGAGCSPRPLALRLRVSRLFRGVYPAVPVGAAVHDGLHASATATY